MGWKNRGKWSFFAAAGFFVNATSISDEGCFQLTCKCQALFLNKASKFLPSVSQSRGIGGTPQLTAGTKSEGSTCQFDLSLDMAEYHAAKCLPTLSVALRSGDVVASLQAINVRNKSRIGGQCLEIFTQRMC